MHGTEENFRHTTGISSFKEVVNKDKDGQILLYRIL